MPKGKLAQPHKTAGMRQWTDLEIEAVYYSLEQPQLLRPTHQAAMKRITVKFRNEQRARKTQ